MSTQPKQTIAKRIGLIADLAIIVTAVLLCVVLIKNYIVTQPAPAINNSTTDAQLQSDAKLSIPGIDWAKSEQTLLLALSSTCHFCSESAPFYRQLVKERGSSVRIIAVLPQSVQAGRDYLNRLGVSVDDVMQVEFNSLGVKGTPTLILADSNGVVLDSWVGKLPSSEEAEVLSRVRQNIAQK